MSVFEHNCSVCNKVIKGDNPNKLAKKVNNHERSHKRNSISTITAFGSTFNRQKDGKFHCNICESKIQNSNNFKTHVRSCMGKITLK